MVKRNFYIFLILSFFIISTANAQTPNWIWSKAGIGTSNDEGYAVCNDVYGNVFIAGAFTSPTLSFGSFTLTNSDNSGNTFDMYLAKYDASGNVLWAISGNGVVNFYYQVTPNLCYQFQSKSEHFFVRISFTPKIYGYYLSGRFNNYWKVLPAWGGIGIGGEW